MKLATVDKCFPSNSASSNPLTTFGNRLVWKSNKPRESVECEQSSSFAWADFSHGLEPTAENYAVQIVDRILAAAVKARATDIHFEARQEHTYIRWRVDGTLLDCGAVPHGSLTSVINRLKALARLVTYRVDIPQEGRINLPEHQLEARVGTLPTLHGERVVLRLATGRTSLRGLAQLGLATEMLDELTRSINAHSGVIVFSGPAGSGKTTTAYACLRNLAENDSPPRSLVTLEDPIEIEVEGVAQSQINPAVGYDWFSGLKALLRQDPEVMLVGEIRDAATASIVFDAAKTGQLVITTMHARSAGDAVRRLLDMQMPAHHLASGLNLLWCQRLIRKLCPCQQIPPPISNSTLCPTCGNSGYDGRLLLNESLPTIEKELARAILEDADSTQLNHIARAAGMRSLAEQAATAVAAKQTSAAEFKRHFTP